MLCCRAALLGLVNELVGGSLIAPAGQELGPSAAAIQWLEAGGSHELTPQAWASLGVALNQQVFLAQNVTHCNCSVLFLHPLHTHTLFRTVLTVIALYCSVLPLYSLDVTDVLPS